MVKYRNGEMVKTFDILIIGAGPAGLTAAIKLGETGLRIAVLEKDVFPREKICGDALSGKVMSVMKRMPEGIFSDFIANIDKTPSLGIRFTSPDMSYVDVPYVMARADGSGKTPPGMVEHAPGYICSRSRFDKFLYDKCREFKNISILENTIISKVSIDNGIVTAESVHNTYTGKMILGADGVHSVVRKSLTAYHENKNHTCLGIRAYYENVSGTHEKNFIELFFLKDLLPGYFWIFPMPGNRFNVGLGMLKSQVVERKINLSKALTKIITSHPQISERFKDAKLIGKFEAHPLPLGLQDEVRSGNHFILLGDAASLVDPFSGEGIGNAMASGEVAADIVKACFEQNRFDADFISQYDRRIYRRIMKDFSYSKIIQRLARSASLFNFVVRRASRNKGIQELLTSISTDERIKKKLTNPLCYLGLLFK